MPKESIANFMNRRNATQGPSQPQKASFAKTANGEMTASERYGGTKTPELRMTKAQAIKMVKQLANKKEGNSFGKRARGKMLGEARAILSPKEYKKALGE